MSAAADVHEPRAVLAAWANEQDEWVRFVVRQVLQVATGLTADDIEYGYHLFRQEKGFDVRVHPAEGALEAAASIGEVSSPLRLSKICKVAGVNAIGPGAVIEPHEGLTILFGENGTGKTGYSRVLKALAGSRSADVILGDIEAPDRTTQSAEITYRLGTDESVLIWDGTHAQAPFTRMSVFDSPAVDFHVDEDLEYLYVPAALALFNHVNAGLTAIQQSIDGARAALAKPSSELLGRFTRGSRVYTQIELLGPTTDLVSLRPLGDFEPQGEERIAQQQRVVSALESDTARTQLEVSQRLHGLLVNVGRLSGFVATFDLAQHAEQNRRITDLDRDYAAFREGLFVAAGLPAEPEQTWHEFVLSGQHYKDHLVEARAYNDGICLYCRQTLNGKAIDLIAKYSEYLEDKIAADLRLAREAQARRTTACANLATTDLSTYVAEHSAEAGEAADVALIRESLMLITAFKTAIADAGPVRPSWPQEAAQLEIQARSAASRVNIEMEMLRELVENRATALKDEKGKLVDLKDAVELGKVWTQVEEQVRDSRLASQLGILAKKIPPLKASVTDLSKRSSDHMVNRSFDALFAEECKALRAPELDVQYVGRQGKSQRRRTLAGRHKPSKVFSEGEQKVLAIADFLAEARLAGADATVVFDDPVSSLDHRRIDEVARRIARLAETTQIVVFTHDILFATKLLSLFESSKRCTYYEITDDRTKGEIARASGPRWDTVKNIGARINETIQDAKSVDGEARAALVRTGYGWLRSWCEVFVECDLLAEVTMRYQPNVKMGALGKIKSEKLPEAIDLVVEVFDRACRYIDSHSQPLVSLGTKPTLSNLEDDWKRLREFRSEFIKP